LPARHNPAVARVTMGPMSLIDNLKNAVSPVVSPVKEKVASAIESVKVEAPKPSAPPPATSDFSGAKSKPVSITGKAKAHAPTASGPTDLKSAVDDLKGKLPPGVMLASNLTGAQAGPAAAPDNELKSAIASGADDKKLRDIINHDPSKLKGLSPEEKGKALERLRSGYTSEGDAHAMKHIVDSCESKQELRKVIGAARGKDPDALSQPDYHKYDKHIAEYGLHPYLVADKLNPANHLPEAPPPPAPAVNENVPPQLHPGKEIDSGDRVNQKVDGRLVRQFKTGENVTKVPDGELDATPAQQAETKAAQKKVLDDMKAKGVDASDPPTIAQTKEYLQKVAGKGTPEETKKLQTALGDYLSAYYKHAGQGVDWGAGKGLADNMEKAFADQPKLKDGRVVIDCEGFAALTQNLIKDIKDPKTKQPMFEMMQGATPNHAIVGVFRKGAPFQEPFMVSNDRVTPMPPDLVDNAKRLNTKGQTESAEKWMLRELVYDEVNGGRELRKQAIAQGREERPTLEAGRTFDTRKKWVGATD